MAIITSPDNRVEEVLETANGESKIGIKEPGKTEAGSKGKGVELLTISTEVMACRLWTT